MGDFVRLRPVTRKCNRPARCAVYPRKQSGSSTFSRGGIMSDMQASSVAAPQPQGAGLSQMQRVINVFSAPSKTFNDIRDHSRSWWLPFVLFIVVGTGLFATVTVKVGWNQVVQNSLRLSPKQAEKMD